MGQVVTEKSTEAKRIAYEVLAEFYPDPWTPAEVTDEVVEAAYTQVKKLYRSNKSGGPKIGVSWLKKSIRKWLENPEAEDWFIDEVAVERAVALDHEAYKNLTHIEMNEVRERLSRMEDPWGWGADVFSPFASDRFVGHGGVPENAPMSERAERWLSWPAKDRDTLKNTVTARRARRAPAAAA